MRRSIALTLLGFGLAVPDARVGAQAVPSGCDSIADTPATFAIDYQQDIQAIFSTRCANCHIGPGPLEADLDLNPEPSWFNLVDVNSSQDTAQIRVIPRDALRSLLFRKVNCDVPGPLPHHDRMPQNRPELPIGEQALIYDWIMAGAPDGATDTIFFNSFDHRGFEP